MKNRNITCKAIIITFLLSTLSACKKFVEVSTPIDQITADEVFTNDATAISAVTGLYDQMMASNLYFMNGAISFYPALSSDELSNTATSTTLNPFYQNAIPANSSIISNSLWRYAYNYIYQANTCIGNIARSGSLSAAVKQQLTGEMLFSRAICYFYLVNLFGDVPLETTSDYQNNEVEPRTAAAKVYDQVTADLVQAEGMLTAAYPTSEKVRPNKYAAAALLARVYLYRKDYVNAETQASLVISSGVYSLSALTKVFLANSTEAIWQLAPVNSTFNSAEGYTFIPSSATVKPSYVLTTVLINSFEAGDQRKTNWVGINTVSGVSYYYPSKYKVKSNATKSEYNMVLRLAEMYLVRAEARIMQSKNAEAVGDLNMIRARAGLTDLASSATPVQITAAIYHENQIEFFTEWGHRWLDLKRTGQIDAVLGGEKTGWQSNAALYPLPSAEILRNPFLVQNPGYN